MTPPHPYDHLPPGRRALQEVIDELSGGYLLKDKGGIERNILLSSISEELVYGGEEISEEQMNWKEMLESAADNIISFLEKL